MVERTTKGTGQRPDGAAGRRTGVAWPLAVLALVAAAFAAFLLATWLDDDEPGGDVTVAGFSDDEAFDDDGLAEALVGREVTMTGEVSEVLEPSAFVLGGEDFGGGGLLVISAEDADVDEGERVQVQGTVITYDAVVLRDDYGIEDFDATRWSAWRDANVVVASSVS